MSKKLVVPVVLGAIVLLGCGVLLSQQSAEDGKLAKLLESYLDEYWKFYPTAATLAGFTKYDAKLEDFSEGAIDKHLTNVDKINAELVNKIARDKLSPAGQQDLDLIRNLIDLGQLRLEKIAPQQLNPMFYNDIIGKCVPGLLAGGAAPLDARVKNAAERIKLLPGFLKQAKENLTNPPKEYTDEATRQFAAILNFYKTQAASLVESAGADAKSKFQAELAKLIPALDDYLKFLQNDLAPKSTGSFRLGEAHQRLLQLTTLGTIPLTDLQQNALADFKNIRRAMLLVSAQFYKIMDPKFDIDKVSNVSEDTLTNNVVPHVLERINNGAAARAPFLERVKNAAAEIKAFLDQTKLFDVPAEVPAVEAMPAALPNQMLASLLTPNPYEQAGTFTVLINPDADALAGEAAQGFQAEFNDYFLKMWTVINVYPGPFVPTVATRKNARLIHKMMPNLPLEEGWPVYAADMFIPAGFGKYDLKLLLNQLKMQMRPAIDFVVELQAHEGNMTKEDAIRLMTVTGFRNAADAERTWNTIVLHPLDSMYAYIGYREILEMEGEYKNAKGEGFSKKEFLQKLISFGPLPFRELKAKVLQ